MSVPAGCGSGRRELLRAEQAERCMCVPALEELEEQRRREDADADMGADADMEAALKWMQRTAEQLQIELLLPPDERRAVVCVPPDAAVADLWTAVHDAGGPPPVLQELAVGGRRLPRAGWRLLRDTGLVRAGARIAVSRRDLSARRVSASSSRKVVLLDSGEVRCFDEGPVPDFSPGSVTSVHVGFGCTAAVVAGKVVVWSDDRVPEDPPLLLEGRSIVCFSPCPSFGRMDSPGLNCAVDTDGKLLLWDVRDDRFAEVPDGLDGSVAAADVMQGRDADCATPAAAVLTHDGAVFALTETLQPPDAARVRKFTVAERADLGGRTALSVRAGNRHFAVLLDDGSVRCFGAGCGQCYAPVGLRGVVSCAAWSDTTFALLDDGSFHCWGLSQDDDPIDTQSLRDAVGASGCVDIEFARWMVSVVTADGRLLCDDGTSYRL
eukprot:TRINITY_DN487_c1_g1_i6.p1 TRINITY_DN487_c1_g1~~TRINITY_DN487_c1_g1_i6.p1  ORF type:complete len:437 (+),score=117.70 TRINITY_DN487_c1_g1_i6:82-1392(+)